MSNQFDDRHLKKLLNEDRIKALRIQDVIKIGKIGGKQNVLDVGAGAGVFSFPIAKAISGQVCALDTSQKMIDFIEQQIEEHTYHNISTKLGSIDMLQEIHFDRIVLVHVIHEVDHKSKFVASLKHLLEPQGLIIVLDWKKQESEKGPQMSIRLSQDDLKDLFSPHFTELERHDWGPDFYLSIFKLK